jgi:chemotaxis protein methyltransferase CheR
MSGCTVSPPDYEFLRNYVYNESGIVLDAGKTYLVESRLAPVLTRRGWKTFNQLVQELRANAPDLRREVVEAMTTHETFFFRDPQQFDALHKSILPELMKKRQAARSLAIWSAAASSGQEAYSVAMLLHELGAAAWRVKILGTDISDQILTRAKQGSYRQMEINRGLPARYLTRFLKQQGTTWQVAPEVKQFTDFRKFDLRDDARALGSFDLVLCRNVLIYFDPPTRERVLKNLHAALTPGGYLLLGAAESASSLAQHFSWHEFGKTIVYRRLG